MTRAILSVSFKIVDFLLAICQSNKQKNRLFSELTSSRWQEENNWPLYSVTNGHWRSGPNVYCYVVEY